MSEHRFPLNIVNLHHIEQSLRNEAMVAIRADQSLLLHLNIIERSMTMAKAFVACPVEDEDFRVLKVLSIRLLNAFASSLQLFMSGYYQNSGMIMRDILETVFLLDLFAGDHNAIKRWRFADRKQQRAEFSPIAVRTALDNRDGDTTKRREDIYKMFCVLTAHPNMHSQHMLKPANKPGDILTGPFIDYKSLKASFGELGRLAAKAGYLLDQLLPQNFNPEGVRNSFADVSADWKSMCKSFALP